MKNRKKKGFTFVETLVALLIVSLLSAVVLTGIRSAWSIHDDALFASESEILASTINTALGDVLHYSSYEQSGSQGTSEIVRISNQNYGILRGDIEADDGKIYIKVSDDKNSSKLVLISDGAYTNIKVTDFSLKYMSHDQSTDYPEGTFYGSYTLEGTDGQTKKITYAFQPINGKVKDGKLVS